MQIVKDTETTAVKLAGDSLRAGKIISFATDTVYGVAVDASNSQAVENLFSLKKRKQKNPIAIFVRDLETAEKIFYFDEISTKIAKNFSGKGLTLVLKQKPECPFKIAANLNSEKENFLGFRIVENKFIKDLLMHFNGILAVSSANVSGQRPATNAQEVKEYFVNSKLDLLLEGRTSTHKTASTVVKVFDRKIEILRHGAINESLINKYL